MVLMNAIGQLLPVSMAVALSPFPIVAVILVLATPCAETNGPLFALGWLVGLTVVTTIVVVVVGTTDKDDNGSSFLLDLARIALGVALLVGAGRKWRTRPRGGEAPTTPAWMAKIDEMDAVATLRLGQPPLLGGVNPKNIVFAMAAGTTIATLSLNGMNEAIGVAVFVAGSATVVGPVLVSVIGGQRAAAPTRGRQAVHAREQQRHHDGRVRHPRSEDPRQRPVRVVTRSGSVGERRLAVGDVVDVEMR